MHALAAESDYVDMALSAAAEFEKLADLFARSGLHSYAQLANEKKEKSDELVKLLEV
jgi:hypothetical protein